MSYARDDERKELEMDAELSRTLERLRAMAERMVELRNGCTTLIRIGELRQLLAYIASAEAGRDAAERREKFQARVGEWLDACFGPVIAKDQTERNHRFLEEAIELVQSKGCTRSEAHQLVDYVFGRPVGEPSQEVGGVMVTLAALCEAAGLDMNLAADKELTRIWQKIERIRAKQAAKPGHSPLPEALAGRDAAERREKVLRDAMEALLLHVSAEPDGRMSGMANVEKRLQWYAELMPLRDAARAALAPSGNGLPEQSGDAAAAEIPMRDVVFAEEVQGTGGWLVTLGCGHKKATREKRVSYPCRECAAAAAGKDEARMVLVGGKPFRCPCGCNVFRRDGVEGKPNQHKYTCNSCYETYIGEKPPASPADAAGGEVGK